MNIEQKVQQAIDEISAMSVAELEQELIDHGYRPARKTEVEYSSDGAFLITEDGQKRIPSRVVPGTEALQHHFIAAQDCDNDDDFLIAA